MFGTVTISVCECASNQRCESVCCFHPVQSLQYLGLILFVLGIMDLLNTSGMKGFIPDIVVDMKFCHSSQTPMEIKLFFHPVPKPVFSAMSDPTSLHFLLGLGLSTSFSELFQVECLSISLGRRKEFKGSRVAA